MGGESRAAPVSAPLSAHRAYLRYVVRHKWFVARAGLAIGGWSIGWLWRLLVHDLSKFSRAEWTPYVCQFYGPSPGEIATRQIDQHLAEYHGDTATTRDTREHMIAERTGQVAAERQRSFYRAWLHHIHANRHHWQHWILHLDDGRVITLVPEHLRDIQEMVADWIGAGPKVGRSHTLAEAIGETIVWYSINAGKMQMRQSVRIIVEELLLGLAEKHGLAHLTRHVTSVAAQRSTITLSGSE